MYNKRENLIQIDEALAVGQRAAAALEETLESLKAAKTLGLWDMLGGNFISGMLKHGKLDNAQEQMEHAKHELERFQKELGDVHIFCDIQIKFEGFSRFADYFFDNILVDYAIQSKIKESCEEVTRLLEQVREAMHRLNELKQYETAQLKGE